MVAVRARSPPGRHLGHGGLEGGAHARDARPFLRGAVACLPGVFGEMEELDAAAVDELPVVRRPRPQRGPPAVQPPEQALGVERLGRDPLAAERGNEVAARHLRPRRKPQQAEKGGGEIHGGDPARDGDTRRHARAGDDQGNVQRGLVEQHGVRDFSVLAERLPVIGKDGHHRVLLVARGAQPVEHAAELRIGVGDLAVVRPAGEGGPVRLGRVVRGMRVVEVHPDEERPVRGRRGQPPEGGVHDVARGTLRPRARDGAVLEVLAERVEALPEPEGGGHGVGAHEGRRAVTPPLQHRGQRLMLRVEREDDVVADAVDGRVEAGEDRRVGGAGQRDRALSVREAGAAGGQPVQARRAGRGVAVRAHVVRAKGVDGDEEEVGARRAMRRPPPESQAEGGEERYCDRDPSHAPRGRGRGRTLRLRPLRARHAGILEGAKDRRKSERPRGSAPGPFTAA